MTTAQALIKHLERWATPACRIRQSTMEDLFPDLLEGEVQIAAAKETRSGVRQIELMYLAYLAAATPEMQIFEFGTAAGRTTLNLALNVRGGHVFSLDLPNNYLPRASTYIPAQSIELSAEKAVLLRSRKLPVTLLEGDSTKFDFSEYYRRMDLVFIDGGHSRECLQCDTENAVRMIRPGGLILWHDYLPKSCPDVVRFLNNLSEQLPLHHITHTKMILYKSPRELS